MAFTRLLKSKKSLLLIAVLVALFSHALTRPINLFDRLRNKLHKSKHTSSQQSQLQQSDNAPYIPGDSCPSDAYTQKKTGCYHSAAQFSLEPKNAVQRFYIATAAGQAPVAAIGHYVSFMVYAQLPGSDAKVPVPGMPLRFSASEEEQVIYAIDEESGFTVKKTIGLRGHFSLKADVQGKVVFWIPIEEDEDVSVQDLAVKAGHSDEWFTFYADTAALNALASVDPSQNPESLGLTSTNGLDAIIDQTQTLVQSTNHQFASASSLVLPLHPGKKHALTKRAKEIDAKEWEETKQSIKKANGIKVIKDKSKKVVKAILKVGEKALELIVEGVKAVVAVLGKIWKLAGTFLKKVLDSVKVAIRWEEVLNTQMAFNARIMEVRKNARANLEKNRETFLNKLAKIQGGFDAQIDAVIASIKKTTPAEIAPVAENPLQNPQTEIRMAVVTDVLAANMDKATCVPEAGEQKEVQVQLEALEVALEGRYPEMSKEIGGIRKTLSELKAVGMDIIVAILTLIKGIFNILKDVVAVSGDFAMKVLEVAIELYWIVMTFEIKIPILSDLFKFVISDGKYELSLLHLTTLTPAIIWTYGYMAFHHGKAPFPTPGRPTIPNTPEQQQQQQQQQSPFADPEAQAAVTDALQREPSIRDADSIPGRRPSASNDLRSPFADPGTQAAVTDALQSEPSIRDADSIPSRRPSASNDIPSPFADPEAQLAIGEDLRSSSSSSSSSSDDEPRLPTTDNPQNTVAPFHIHARRDFNMKSVLDIARRDWKEAVMITLAVTFVLAVIGVNIAMLVMFGAVLSALPPASALMLLLVFSLSGGPIIIWT
ncbi:hypothetical protein HK102_012955 [Quaeritorhiza haematococci]|nr:hypothetical protein HK102_012955 [Quaeritorhiza haematococci]